MNRVDLLRRCRHPTFQSWLGAVLVVLLLLAEATAVAHPFDAAAHADGQPCTICLSAHTFGAGAISTPRCIDLDAAAPLPVAAAVSVHTAALPLRQYARGPPAVSFAS